MTGSKIQTYRNDVSAGDFTDWKRQAAAFQDLNAWTGTASLHPMRALQLE